MAQETVGNTIKIHRQMAGLTQEDFAQRIGVTRQTIIAMEKGNYVPSVLLALKIAREFEKPLEEIFYVDESG
ncbi:helix-turn-helix transcriptional regulator [Spirochaeta lutea]|uniref:helix-turn-helix transcriptional regulator n=1 Tax=Spirochaeta lutea TaxID=1480694 RepID=UPI00056A380C|nr:helix-turn-helix transcriptional regulator [Spirochaeta lutea]